MHATDGLRNCEIKQVFAVEYTRSPPRPCHPAHPYLISKPMAHVDTNAGTIQRNVKLLFLAILVAYTLSAAYAIVTGRPLYGDASWFLVKILSTGDVTRFYDTFDHIYYSRLTAYWLTQFPTVIALHLKVYSIQILSLILGSTYYAVKLASLVICYFILPKTKKKYFLFPLFALFAGSINSDIYLVSETNVAVSFLWPLAFLLTDDREIRIPRWLIGSVAIVAASFTYESWAFFAPLLLVAGIITLKRSKLGNRRRLGSMVSLLLVPTLTNWLAILVPRDAENKGGFVLGAVKAFTDTRNGFPSWHVEILASTLAAITFLMLLTLSHRTLKHNVAKLLFALIALAIVIVPPLQYMVIHNGLEFGYSIMDRGVGGVAIQVGLLLLYIACLHTPAVNVSRAFALSTTLLCALVVSQISCQLIATRSWVNATRAVQTTVATRAGAIPCDVIDHHDEPVGTPPPSTIICSWWAYPLSVLYARHNNVGSILIPHNLTFQPFDPFVSSDLPHFISGGPHYARYETALTSDFHVQLNKTYTFTSSSPSTVMLRNGFSYPESWGTWTDASRASMHVCIPHINTATNVQLTFTITPFLVPRQPALSAIVKVAGRTVADWTFRIGRAPPVNRQLVINPQDLPASGCSDITFEFPTTRRSPLQLGVSSDPRNLGFAIIRMRASADISRNRASR